MFSIFKKNTKRSFPDKVWKTKAIAWKHVAREAIIQTEIPVVVFFFKSEHDQFDAFLNSLNVPYWRITEGENFESSLRKVFTVHAFSLESAAVMDTLSRHSKNSKLSFLFFGHHPLPKRENQVLEKIVAGIGPDASVSFWVSLEDPLMRFFGSDRIKPLLETLGLNDEECIEHALVSKSIERAREKIASKVKIEVEATSEEDWFAKNLKQ